ncbi:hybrid sensor histidine kinase/response regulator [Citreimonas salinaria]|uniref:histidine kinase n=1 Tax=Citreimonas salinaria TaxID=321339 RepID=A0A1H3FIG1_9RHOB|nr:hybrid sensor histidine kinase/response regulator [Citreimonas salinaria]SDX90720.1 hypothetical protein SAMN05444340_101460 [Citreimonas salinaria]
MSLIDPTEPMEVQLARQGKIIEALVRRATRENDVGQNAYSAFQSAMELQTRVAARDRDLARATTELESVRVERERTRKNLDQALSAMGEGFALFANAQLDVCNDLFLNLLPDISGRVVQGIALSDYVDLVNQSRHVVSIDRRIEPVEDGVPSLSSVLELTDDRWYQVAMQRTSPDSMVLLLTEITAIVRRNRSEKEHLIDKQAAYLQAMFENMTSGMCSFSAAGDLVIHNKRFRQMTGLSFTALQKRITLTQLLRLLSSRGYIAEGPLQQVDAWRVELTREGHLRRQVRNHSGEVFDLQANMLPDGGFLIELKDITLEIRATETLEGRVKERTLELTRTNERLTQQYEAKARVEEELRLAKERAEAAVSSKTRFLAAASHDLLQPINAAKLLIATLRQNADGTDFAPMIDRLKGAFSSMEQLLRALLDISRLDSAEQDAVNPAVLCLGHVMQTVFEDQMPLAQERGVDLRMVPCMAEVRSDPVYLRRSVQNLVVNAIQYSRPGGRVLLGCRRSEDRVVLQVWDTGIGIGEADQSRIFDEFARAGNVPAGSGVGLGLSIVERTCRHLGHRLWMSSEIGVGSVFCIEFETVGRAEPARDDLQPPTVSGNFLAEHIAMVVENDEDVLFATTQTLQAWGAAVLAARSTDEALRHVRDISMPPDIVLVDYQLDNGDTGLDAIRRIRAATHTHVPAIMITADRREALLRAGSEEDFVVMTKPVRLSRLRPLIEWKLSESAAAIAPKVDGDTGDRVPRVD